MRFLPIAKLTGLGLCLIAAAFDAHSQNAPVMFKSDANLDSLSKAYDAPVPWLSSGLIKKGISFPQPFGASVNLYYDTQNLDIKNLKLGLNGGTLTSLEGVLTTDTYTESTQTVSFQADAWVLPFLKLYGMAGITNIDAQVKLDIPSEYNLSIDTKGSFVGYGATLAGILGSVYISGDIQSIHTFSEHQDKGDICLTSGVRVGPVFNFKNNPNRNLVVWIGGLYTNYTNTSSGSYDALDLFPDAESGINREITNLDTWYNGLSASDQATYADKYNDVKDLLTSVVNNVDDTVIDYELEKRLNMPWDMAIGAEYQLSPMFLVKAEAQFLGSRTAVLVSINYRFGNN